MGQIKILLQWATSVEARGFQPASSKSLKQLLSNMMSPTKRRDAPERRICINLFLASQLAMVSYSARLFTALVQTDIPATIGLIANSFYKDSHGFQKMYRW